MVGRRVSALQLGLFGAIMALLALGFALQGPSPAETTVDRVEVDQHTAPPVSMVTGTEEGFVARSSVETTEGWSFDPDGETAEPAAEAARTGDQGVLIVGEASQGTPSATYDGFTPRDEGRFWSFVNLPDDAPDDAFAVLSLVDESGDTIATLEPGEDDNVTLNVDGTEHRLDERWPEPDGLHADNWTKLELDVAEDRIRAFVNNQPAATVQVDSLPAVDKIRFRAASETTGRLYADDVGVHATDPIVRSRIHKSFYVRSMDRTDGGIEYPTEDPRGNEAMRVNSSPADSHALVDRTFWQTVPAYWVNLQVGNFTSDEDPLSEGPRGCSGLGYLLRLFDVRGEMALGIRCEEGRIEVLDGDAWASTSAHLAEEGYSRLVIRVGEGDLAVRVDDEQLGSFELASWDRIDEVRVGGGDADLYFSDLRIQRGGFLHGVGFEAGLDAWAMEASGPEPTLALGGIEVNVTDDGGIAQTSTEHAYEGETAVHLRSDDDADTTSFLARPLDLPDRPVRFSTYVYVPEDADYDRFRLFSFPFGGGETMGAFLRTSLTGVHHVEVFRSDQGSQGTQRTLTDGWNRVAIDLEPHRGTWGIQVDEDESGGFPLPSAEFDKIRIGDTLDGTEPSGAGELFVDTTLAFAGNTPPFVTIDEPAGDTVSPGTVTVAGTVRDPDPADAPARMDYWVRDVDDYQYPVEDGPVANAPNWTLEWDTSNLEPGHEYKLRVKASGGGTHGTDARWYTVEEG